MARTLAIVVTRSDAPAALLMALLWLAFGAFSLFRPEKLRAAMDRIADSYKQGTWHPYKMPLPLLRLTGVVEIAGAALFSYIAYIGFTR